MQIPTSPWNSLEIVKVAVSTLTPLAVLIIGVWITRRQKQLDALREKQHLLQQRQLDFLQWTNQKVIEKRIAVFGELAPLLNDVYCFFMFVGGWKALKPPDVVAKKRQMDRIVHVNRPLFSNTFFDTYQAFIDACYLPYIAFGQDAQLRTSVVKHQEPYGDSWQIEWNDCFVCESKPAWHIFAGESDVTDQVEVESAYQSLMSTFSVELGISSVEDHAGTGSVKVVE